MHQNWESGALNHSLLSLSMCQQQVFHVQQRRVSPEVIGIRAAPWFLQRLSSKWKRNWGINVFLSATLCDCFYAICLNVQSVQLQERESVLKRNSADTYHLSLTHTHTHRVIAEDLHISEAINFSNYLCVLHTSPDWHSTVVRSCWALPAHLSMELCSAFLFCPASPHLHVTSDMFLFICISAFDFRCSWKADSFFLVVFSEVLSVLLSLWPQRLSDYLESEDRCVLNVKAEEPLYLCLRWTDGERLS